MAHRLRHVLRQLHSSVDALSDAQLLAQFINARDETPSAAGYTVSRIELPWMLRPCVSDAVRKRDRSRTCLSRKGQGSMCRISAPSSTRAHCRVGWRRQGRFWPSDLPDMA